MRARNMRSWKNIILTAAAAVGLTGVAGTAYADSLRLGNNSANIMNDGVIATSSEGATYYANGKDGGRLYVREGEDSRRLSKRSCRDINVIGSDIWFVTEDGSAIICLHGGKTEEVVYTSETSIEEMYVAGDGRIFFLADGDVFRLSPEAEEETEAETETETAEATEAETAAEPEALQVLWDADKDILHFIPTSRGVIYATGKAGDMTLWADGEKIGSHVGSFYEMEGMLYLLASGRDYEAETEALFSRGAAALEERKGTTVLAASFHGEDEVEECEECNANAARSEGEPGEAGDWAAAASVYGSLMEGEGLSASTATGARSILYDSNVSDGQRNMVRRAYQMHLVEWTPRADIIGWNEEYTYEKGTTYHGLPYGQPVTVGGYVPWSHSLEKFVGYVNDLSSNMYKSYSSYNKRAPYYSTDCSGFVSWAWNTSGRLYTRVFADHATQVSSQSVYSVQIGDAFCKAGSHVVMVSDIGVNSKGTIVYIDIIEETPPITKLTRYGTGGSKTLDQMSTKYLGNGYVLLRSNTRTKVTYASSGVVVLQDESAGNITMTETSVQLGIGEKKTLTYKTDTTSTLTPTWSSSDTDVATVSSAGVVTAVAPGQATINLKIGVSKASVTVTVQPAKVVLVSAENTADGVKVTWKKAAGATSYWVYRKLEKDTTWTLISKQEALTYTDQAKLSPNTKYIYTAKAVAEHSDGTLSKGLWDNNGVSVITPPAAPKLADVIPVSCTSQKITWEPSEGAVGYYLYARVGTGSWSKVTDTKETEFTRTGLTCGTTYTYMVKAYRMDNGAVVAGEGDAEGISKICCPPAPVLGKITPVSATAQQVSWNKVEGATGYYVYMMKPGDTKWTTLGSTTALTYKKTGLTTGINYTYTVRAYRTVNSRKILGNYVEEGISKVCCPLAPALKTLTTSGYGQQTLTWSKVAGVDGYQVYYKIGSADTWRLLGKTTAESFTVKDLSIGTRYTYTVRAYITVKNVEVRSNYNATGLGAVCVTQTPKLGTVSVNTPTSQKVTWTPVPGAEGYQIYRKAGATAKWAGVLVVEGADAAEGIVEGLTPGTDYYYTVRAFNVVDGARVRSGYDDNGIHGVCLPPQPVLGKVTALSPTSQKVQWEAVEGVVGYRVYYKVTGSTKWVAVGNTPVNEMELKDLSCGKTYTYTVRAYMLEGKTNVLSTYDAAGISGRCIPARVTLKSAAAVGSGRISVSWNAAEGAELYRVYRKTGDSGWKGVANTTALTWTDKGLTNGETYYYTVRAVAYDGTTAVLGNYVAAGIGCRLLPQRTILDTAVSSSQGQVKLTWKPVSGCDGYRVYYRTEGSGWKGLRDTKDTQIVLDGLASGQTYSFTVRAFWKADGVLYLGYYQADGISAEIR